MGTQRPARRRMVDRRERRHLQDGKRKNRQSKCHVHHQRRGLGRHVQWETQRHMGLYDWQAESPRQSGSSEKARRNISLEFRRDLKLDERGGVRFGACFGPKEIKVALDSNPATEGDLKWLEPRIRRLYPSLILAVLNDGVMHLQLPLGSYDIIGSVAF